MPVHIDDLKWLIRQIGAVILDELRYFAKFVTQEYGWAYLVITWVLCVALMVLIALPLGIVQQISILGYLVIALVMALSIIRFIPFFQKINYELKTWADSEKKKRKKSDISRLADPAEAEHLGSNPDLVLISHEEVERGVDEARK